MVIMEYRMDNHQNIKNRNSTQFSYPTSGLLPKEEETLIQTNICTPMFTKNYNNLQ